MQDEKLLPPGEAPAAPPISLPVPHPAMPEVLQEKKPSESYFHLENKLAPPRPAPPVAAPAPAPMPPVIAPLMPPVPLQAKSEMALPPKPMPVVPSHQPAPVGVPSPKAQSWGALLSIIIIVLMVTVGAFYAWGKRVAQEQALTASSLPR